MYATFFLKFNLRGNAQKQRQLIYLAGIFSSVWVAGANHSIGDIQFSMRQPRITDLSVENRNLDLIHGWFIFSG